MCFRGFRSSGYDTAGLSFLTPTYEIRAATKRHTPEDLQAPS